MPSGTAPGRWGALGKYLLGKELLKVAMERRLEMSDFKTESLSQRA